MTTDFSVPVVADDTSTDDRRRARLSDIDRGSDVYLCAWDIDDRLPVVFHHENVAGGGGPIRVYFPCAGDGRDLVTADMECSSLHDLVVSASVEDAVVAHRVLRELAQAAADDPGVVNDDGLALDSLATCVEVLARRIDGHVWAVVTGWGQVLGQYLTHDFAFHAIDADDGSLEEYLDTATAMRVCGTDAICELQPTIVFQPAIDTIPITGQIAPVTELDRGDVSARADEIEHRLSAIAVADDVALSTNPNAWFAALGWIRPVNAAHPMKAAVETQGSHHVPVTVGEVHVYLDYRSNAVTELRVLVDAADDVSRWDNYPWDAMAAGAGTVIARDERRSCGSGEQIEWLGDLTVTVDNPTLARQALVALPVMYTDPRIGAGARRAVLQICDALFNELTGWQWRDEDGVDDTSLIALLAKTPDTPISDTGNIDPAAVHNAVRSGLFHRSRLPRRVPVSVGV